MNSTTRELWVKAIKAGVGSSEEYCTLQYYTSLPLLRVMYLERLGIPYPRRKSVVLCARLVCLLAWCTRRGPRQSAIEMVGLHVHQLSCAHTEHR